MPSKKILVADDEPDAVSFVEAILSEFENVTTLSAGDGDSALARAKEAKPDLIILDVQMPGKSGFKVFADLQQDKTTRDIPVIMLTGIANKTGIKFSADDMEEYYGKPPAAYVEKPVDPEVLKETVSKLLGI